MLSVENRTPSPGKEGRVRIRLDSGQVVEGILEMADDASFPGTPWDKQSGRMIQADILTYPVKTGYAVEPGDVVDVSGGEIVSRRTQARNVAVGSTVMINEDGAPVEYIVVQKGKPSSLYDTSCDGVWLLRKDIISEQPFQSDRNNVYETSDVKAWIENNVLPKYDPDLGVKQVKIPYYSGGGSSGSLKTGANGLSCKIFLLSMYELGWTKSDSSYIPEDGAVLEYFDVDQYPYKKRVATYNGAPKAWHTRSPRLTEAEQSYYVTATGDYSYSTFASSSYGVRPAIVLSYDAMVVSAENSTRQAIALQSGDAGDDVEIVFSGGVYADWVTEGQRIESDGVRGYGESDGLLKVYPHWFGGAPVVQGSGVSPSNQGQQYAVKVELGFRPSLIAVSEYGSTWDFSTDTLSVYLGGSSSSYTVVFNITDDGFTVYADGSNATAKSYKYLAFR